MTTPSIRSHIARLLDPITDGEIAYNTPDEINSTLDALCLAYCRLDPTPPISLDLIANLLESL
jgi:hypothetical protein